MNYSKLDTNICRICLEHNANLNWNDELLEFPGMSYRDCYYKYTLMEEIDSDSYPTTLCQRCADELRNAHDLFERALKSFIIFQNTDFGKVYEFFCIEPLKDFDESSVQESNTILGTALETDEAICCSPLPEEKIPETHEYDSKTISINQIKKEHNFKSSCKTLLERRDLGSPRDVHIHEMDEKPGKGNEDFNYTSYNKKSFENIDTQQSDSVVRNVDLFEPSSKTELIEANVTSKKQVNVDASENFLLKQKNFGNVNNPTAVDTNETSPLEDQFSLETNGDNSKETKSYIPSEIALLKKIYGKDFEAKPAKPKTKQVKRSKAREKICQYCSLVVLGKGAILNHEATHLENRERNEICPKCGLKFYTKESLNAHIKIHDENREKKHKCQYCEKAFYHSGARNVHQRKHLGLMVKCPMCPKEFLRQVDVDKHLPSHSASMLNNGAKRIKHKVHCQYCNKYIMTNSWKSHKAAHLKEPQVKCKLCEREFYSRNSCVNHLQKKHGKHSEYEQHIHTYNKTRMTHLMIRQQEAVETLIE